MGPVLAFSIPRRGSRNGSSREPVESIGNLQDCFPRAGIGQLPCHLPRLLGTIQQPFDIGAVANAYRVCTITALDGQKLVTA